MKEKYREYTLSLLETLISCDTTDYHEGNGQAVVERELKKLPCEIRRIVPDPAALRQRYAEFNDGHTYGEDRYCLSATFRGTGGGRSLIFNAHIDTVFPAQPGEWHTEPFCPVEREGKLYGLGACDTKAGLAAMLSALKIMCEEGNAHRGDIIFQSVVDEEAGGGNGTLACLAAGDTADAALIAEPTGLVPASAHVGSYAAKVTVAGKSAHANLKNNGISAFEKALPVIEWLHALGAEWSERKWPTLPAPVLSLVSVRAGDGSMTIPGSCELLINFTYLPDGYDYEAQFHRTLRQCEQADPWLCGHPLLVEKIHDVKPCYSDPRGEWPEHVRRELSGQWNKEVRIEGMGCGADARFFCNQANIPAVILGPGDIGDAHRPNEFVEIGQVYRATEAYLSILSAWCG